jgi:hypothetical protein
MATSTILQTLNPAANGGLASASHRRQVETYIASGTIAKGDVVAFDDGKTGADRALYVEQAGIVATGNGLAAGVALNDAVANGYVQVVVAGYVESVSCAGGVGTAAVVNAAGTAAGQVEAAAATDTVVFGVTVGPVAGSRVDMIVFKRF